MDSSHKKLYYVNHTVGFKQTLLTTPGIFKLWVAVQSRAARYTNINYELRYCLVRFFNHKGHDLKHELRVLKPGRTLVAITEMSQSEGSLNARSALLMRRNLLTSLRLCSAWDCINRKILMLQKLFQVCSISSISSVWTWHCLSLRDIQYIFCVYLKLDTSVHYPGCRLREVHRGVTYILKTILSNLFVIFYNEIITVPMKSATELVCLQATAVFR